MTASALVRYRILAGFACMAAAASWPASGGGTLEQLPVPPGAVSSAATAVSADGSVVAGSASTSGPVAITSAMRWTAGETLNLGGSPVRNVSGMSADGSVMTGTSQDPVAYQATAYRWTRAEGIVPLGGLNGGTTSFANGISADGSTIVGYATDPANGGYWRAFRWTGGTGMVGLGALPGASSSAAHAANSDGTSIVGYSTVGATSTRHAVLWTPASGITDLGVLPGLPSSVATAVSASAAVIVGGGMPHDAGGNPNPDLPGARAFRWTAAAGLVSLGTLNGGPSSRALGVSADGRVIVGYAKDGSAGDAQRAFRWTESSGMQTVEAWLAANGASVQPGIATSRAHATSADGSVVVGVLEGEHAYVARVTPAFGSGLITFRDFELSAQPVSALAGARSSSVRAILEGVHSHPLSRLVPPGTSGIWIAGDAGLDEHGARNGKFGLAEVAIARRFSQRVQAGAAIGATYTRSDAYGGGTLDSRYVFLETNVAPAGGDKFWLTASLLYDRTQGATLRRTYLNAGRLDASSGDTTAESYAASLRADVRDVGRVGRWSFKPYAQLAWVRTTRDAYTESGGAFPARFDAQRSTATQGRLGLEAAYPLAQSTRLVAGLAQAHLARYREGDLNGSLLGLFGFSVPAPAVERNWTQATVGVESKIGRANAAAYLNATTQGPAPAYWLAVSIGAAF